MVQQRSKVIYEAAAPQAVGVGALTEAAVVERDHAMRAREERHLLKPTDVVATGAVCEDQRRPLAVRFVVEIDAVDRGHGHGSPPKENDPPQNTSGGPFKSISRNVLVADRHVLQPVEE